MAILLNTGEQVLLRSHHVFGRHCGSANTLLDNPEASRVHAIIRYSVDHWQLQDNSSNGTYLNGKRFIHGLRQHLHQGEQLSFGDGRGP